MTETLHVLFTMDCTPAPGTDRIPGPPSWERSRAAVRAVTDALAPHAIPPTLFVTPQAFRRNAPALEHARAAGAEVALLCHTQFLGYSSYFGNYTLDLQEEILGVAREAWEREAGHPPGTIRTGFFSANDVSWHAFLLAGFAQGSCSLPALVSVEQCADWNRAFPLAHHTDPLDRRIRGSLEFFEVPVTSDFTARPAGPEEDLSPACLRIEDPAVEERFPRLLQAAVDRAAEPETEIASLTFTTSAAVPWGRPEDPHLDRLHRLLQALRAFADEHHLTLAPVTVAQAHQAADQLWLDQPPEP
jgi:hypothetical protein